MLARYVVRRLLGAVLVLWLAVTLAFVAMQITPGDPAQALLAASGATPQEVAERRSQLGLDQAPLMQYLRYIADLAHGRLGESWLYGRPVGRIILEQLPPTLALAGAATVAGTLLGLVLGFLAAVRRSTWIDTLATGISVLALATPTYWSGLLAILFFSVYLRWLPSTGSGDVRHLILPAAVLGFALSGSIARVMRAQIAAVLREQFVVVAHAKGLSRRRVLVGHVLRNALGPALTVAALQFGFLLSGAVVTESVFARPGLGKLALQAITWRDLPVVRGTMVVAALAFVLTSLAADVVRGWLDPRLREEWV